jgi:hypothetical protein
MPQPIRGPLTDLHFEKDAVVQREKLAAHFLCALNEWSRTEGTFGLILGQILKVRYSVATELLGSVVNLTARLDLVKAAARARLVHNLAEEVIQLMDKARSRAGERNDLAHGIWGISKDYPDKLLRCPPQHAFVVINKHMETGIVARDVLEELRPHLEVWDDKSLVELQHRFFDLQNTVIGLSNKISREPSAP